MGINAIGRYLHKPLIGKAKFFVDKMHQPCGAYKQKLQVLEKRWFFALDLMAVKLPDPSKCEYDQTKGPKREGKEDVG